MAAKEIIDTIAEALAEAWGTLFMKQIGLSAEDPQSASDFTDFEAGDYLVGSVTFSGGINVETRYFIPEKEALTMAGMIMAMGADDALIDSTREGSFEDDQLDAIKEAFNQLSATAATVLREKLNCEVSGSPNTTEKVTLETALPDLNEEDKVIKYTLNLEGYEDGLILQTISSDFLDSLENGIETDDASEDDLLDMLGESDEESGEQEDIGEETNKTSSAPETSTNPLMELIQAKGHLKIKADVVLAERTMEVNQLLGMGIGTVIEFWKPCDDPAEMNFGNTAIACGEIVVSSDQHFCLRVTEIAPPKKTYQKGS